MRSIIIIIEIAMFSCILGGHYTAGSISLILTMTPRNNVIFILYFR